MVEVDGVQHYLNPITLEAQLFLNSLETFGKTCNQMDENLVGTLEKVLSAIEKFLEQQPVQIVATEKTHLVVQKELSNIQRVYHCGRCKLDLGKTVDKAVSHLVCLHRIKTRTELRREKVYAERERRNAVIALPKKVKSLIVSELPKFFNENIQVAEKLKKIPEYDLIEKDLLALMTPLFPDTAIKLYKFGSRITGIGTRNSDLDIFVDIDNTFNIFENYASEETLDSLVCVRDALRKHGKIWPHLRAIEKARVPILRVSHARTGIECDIGFSNSLGYCNTKLMEYLYELQPITRRMCLFLKRWLDRSKLCDNISTYSMCLMVIYFLQLNKHLPAIEQLQTDLVSTLEVGPWVANFLEKTLLELDIAFVEVKTEPCKILLKRFFEFYADFSFATHVVCPYLGRPVEIKDIEAEMPQRYTEYISFSDSARDSALQLQKCLIVQDPIQLNHNVTKGVTPYVLKHLTDFFQQSAEAFAAHK